MPYKSKEQEKKYNKMYYEELKRDYPEKYEEIKRKAREQSKKQYEKKKQEQGLGNVPKRKYTKRTIIKETEDDILNLFIPVIVSPPPSPLASTSSYATSDEKEYKPKTKLKTKTKTKPKNEEISLEIKEEIKEEIKYKFGEEEKPECKVQ